jgi:hypothetical protein
VEDEAVIGLLHSLVLACPTCARQDSGWAGIVLLGTMLTLPFGVAFVVFRVARQGENRPAAPQD